MRVNLRRISITQSDVIIFLGILSAGLSLYKAADIFILSFCFFASIIGLIKGQSIERFLALLFISICILCFVSVYFLESYTNSNAGIRALVYFTIFPGLVLFFKHANLTFQNYSVRFLFLYLVVLSALIGWNYSHTDLLQMHTENYYIGNMYLPEVVRLLIIATIVFRVNMFYSIVVICVCLVLAGSSQTFVIYLLLLSFRLFGFGFAKNAARYVLIISVIAYPSILAIAEQGLVNDHNYYVRMIAIKNALSLVVDGNFITPFIGSLSLPEYYIFSGDYRIFNHEFEGKRELIGLHNTVTQVLYFFSIFGVVSFLGFIFYTLKDVAKARADMIAMKLFMLSTLAISLSANTAVFSVRYLGATAMLVGLAAAVNFKIGGHINATGCVKKEMDS